MFGSILGWIGIGLGAIGAIGSFLAASDRSDALDAAAEQRNRAKEIEDRKNKIKARRERMKLIREARIKRAAAVANATAQGAVGSVRGGFGSIISQSNSGLGHLNQMMSLTDQQNIFFNRSAQFSLQARKAGERANLFGAASKFGGTIFSNRNDIASLF
mgnify:CR=1 FL=1|jgi:hypothetical protein|tara:strand:- start:768 stop:1244 length:477 start_codon:yes stop_codon:yes gene_type:complete